MAAMLDDVQVNIAKMRQDAAIGFATATDLADWLVKNLHVSFRKAHHISGAIVKIAEKKQCKLEEIDLKTMQSIEPKITNEIYQVLDIINSVKNKTSYGGTAPNNIKAAIQLARSFSSQ
jgi:argininosuccinate lyase